MRGGEERKVRRTLCVLSSSFFYTLCDSWSPAWSKFNILTMAAFNEGPLVCILPLWVIIVMQNIRVGGEPCPPFITCSRQELLQLRPAASNGPDHDFNCSGIKLKPRKRGQRGGVWVRNNRPGYYCVLHSVITMSVLSWLIGLVSRQLVCSMITFTGRVQSVVFLWRFGWTTKQQSLTWTWMNFRDTE